MAERGTNWSQMLHESQSHSVVSQSSWSRDMRLATIWDRQLIGATLRSEEVERRGHER